MGNVNLFTIICSKFWCPSASPSKQPRDGFPLQFAPKELQPKLQTLSLRCLESRFAVRSASNRHRFAAISNRMIGIARPKTVQIDVKA